MRRVNGLIVSLLFILMQMLLSPRFALGEVTPDFMLLLVAYFAVRRGPEQAAIVGFAVGLFQDLFNPEFLGLNALAKSLVGYGISVIGSKTDADNSLLLGALLASAAAVGDFVYLLFFTGLHLGKFFTLWVTVSIPSALYTALIGVILHWVARALGSKAGRSLGKARY
jgi:rod shape-determining protein MreD